MRAEIAARAPNPKRMAAVLRFISHVHCTRITAHMHAGETPAELIDEALAIRGDALELDPTLED